VRRRWVWDRQAGALVEVSLHRPSEPLAPAVWDDLPPYESPIDGKLVDGRRQRREDLLRSGCRPYEGRQQEAQEAAKIRQRYERQLDQAAEKMAYRAWDQAPERVRRVFRGR